MSALNLSRGARRGAVSSLRSRRLRRFALHAEPLELRQLLSVGTGGYTANAVSTEIVEPAITFSPLSGVGTPTGLSPSQIQTAYGVNQISSGSVIGNGAGQTIAIIDAYLDPNISSDLATFDSQYGLVAPPSFTQYVENGLGGDNSGWALETALDVEWAHAIAPAANIVLVEARPDLNDLFSAVSFASQLSGVSVVSMSWGTGEFSGETAYDSVFTTPAGHNGVTFVAGSGDSGTTEYPSASPNVLSVGGTTLTVTSQGGYVSETGWSDSGTGYSRYESEPAYQKSVQTTGKRSTPDVAWDANPSTGVSVYDSVPYYGQSGWFTVGGTSVGAPSWAGLIAITDQGLAQNGIGSLSNAQASLYQLSSTDFNHPGSDTGLGSPKANLLVPALVQLNTPTSTPEAKVAVAAAKRPDPVVGLVGRNDLLPPTLTNPTNTGTGSTTSSGTFGLQALVTQVSSTQAQSVAQQATVVTPVNQSTAAPPSLGQSLPQQPQNSSPSLAIDESIEPKWLIEDARAVPSPAAAQQTAPAPDQMPAPAPDQMPADEAPAVSPAPAPNESVDDPATGLLDEALARISLSMAARRLELSSGPTSEPEQATETLSDRSVSTLAGAAALAVGGYRVLLGRSDRIKRHWMPGRFM